MVSSHLIQLEYGNFQGPARQVQGDTGASEDVRACCPIHAQLSNPWPKADFMSGRVLSYARFIASIAHSKKQRASWLVLTDLVMFIY